MRHPLAALTAGILLAAMPVLRASDEPRAALSQEPAAASASRLETIVRAPQTVTGPIPIGVEADVYCSGYLGEPAEVFPGAIVSAEKEKNQTFFMQGDIVYLDIGERDGVQAGMEFTIVRPQHAREQVGLGHRRRRPHLPDARPRARDLRAGAILDRRDLLRVRRHADRRFRHALRAGSGAARAPDAGGDDVRRAERKGDRPHRGDPGRRDSRRDRLGRLPGPRRSRRPESRATSSPFTGRPAARKECGRSSARPRS